MKYDFRIPRKIKKKIKKIIEKGGLYYGSCKEWIYIFGKHGSCAKKKYTGDNELFIAKAKEYLSR